MSVLFLTQLMPSSSYPIRRDLRVTKAIVITTESKRTSRLPLLSYQALVD